MRSAFVYNFLIEANIMASIAIILMIPLRKFFRKQLGNSAICFGWLLGLSDCYVRCLWSIR